MTPVGLITLSGLVAVLGYIVTQPCSAKVKHLWGYLFGFMILVTASYQAGLSPKGHAFAYMIPALAVAIWTASNFRTWEGYSLAALFLMNSGGNFYGVDTYKFLTVDILDVFAWVQIGLLMALARKNTVEDAMRESAADSHSHKEYKRLRLISGGYRNSRPHRS